MKNQIIQLLRKLQAISQNGLIYADSEFHKDRYNRVLEIAIELFSINTQVSEKDLNKVFLEQKGYATPKIDTRAVIVKNEKILFVKETDDQRWSLPGGWVEVGETPSTSIVKEVKEECGLQVKVNKLIGVYDKDLHQKEPTSIFQVLSFFFLCDITESNFELKTQFETEGVGFFSADNVPPLSTSRINKWQIEMVFKHVKDPNLSTDFD